MTNKEMLSIIHEAEGYLYRLAEQIERDQDSYASQIAESLHKVAEEIEALIYFE